MATTISADGKNTVITFAVPSASSTTGNPSASVAPKPPSDKYYIIIFENFVNQEFPNISQPRIIPLAREPIGFASDMFESLAFVNETVFDSRKISWVFDKLTDLGGFFRDEDGILVDDYDWLFAGVRISKASVFFGVKRSLKE